MEVKRCIHQQSRRLGGAIDFSQLSMRIYRRTKSNHEVHLSKSWRERKLRNDSVPSNAKLRAGVVAANSIACVPAARRRRNNDYSSTTYKRLNAGGGEISSRGPASSSKKGLGRA